MRFTGRNVLVAGGAGALGSAVSLAFLSEGAFVTVTGRSREPFERLLAAAGPGRDRLAFLAGDAADPVQAAAAVAAAARGGRLHAAVNTVGGWAGGAPLADEPPDRLARMITSNLAPAHALLRAAVPSIARGGGGAFVEIASTSAVGPQPGQASYAAAKAAVLSLVFSVAEEVRGQGVRVNAVLPGTMDTEANRAAMPSADPRGWVKTAEVAEAVLFLCSDGALAISGTAVPVRR
jgi:NAD(P)-dependent dehydrogenase (short-subunit alcohol dehydrogenase family)